MSAEDWRVIKSLSELRNLRYGHIYIYIYIYISHTRVRRIVNASIIGPGLEHKTPCVMALSEVMKALPETLHSFTFNDPITMSANSAIPRAAMQTIGASVRHIRYHCKKFLCIIKQYQHWQSNQRWFGHAELDRRTKACTEP
jgi:hypothetical protein